MALKIICLDIDLVSFYIVLFLKRIGMIKNSKYKTKLPKNYYFLQIVNDVIYMARAS